MDKIRKLVSDMTLEEKASLLSGDDFWHTKAVSRLGIARAMVSDGPHGLRKQDDSHDNLGINDSIEAVCFPSAAGVAASFDRNLIFKMADALGKECRAEGVAVLLGPAVNIKRSPLCGRNFEYLSEDPYLAGELAASYVKGVQQNDIGVSVKHFAANNQEYRRMATSAEVDTRALHEIYLAPFESAVKQAKPWTLMCSYNKINGVFSSDNHWLLTDVLRDRWGFDGFVMTDWGAIHDRATDVWAGLELEMPASGGVNDKKVVAAVQDGSLDERLVDEAAYRILSVLFRYWDSKQALGVFDRKKDHALAAEIARDTQVLLKNNGVLPLNPQQRVVLIGEFAKSPRYQGGGSSHIHPHRVVGAVEALANNKNVSYAQGYSVKKDAPIKRLEQEAVLAAQSADVAVVFLGLPDAYESEGYDRNHLDLPAYQNSLLQQVLAVQKNVVVVLHNGSPVTMPWVDQVGAILESYLAGEGVGQAQADILYGAANPSAKLAETFPIALSDTPCHAYFPGGSNTVEYRESIYVGYRYYLSANRPVLFPFGHGLSYTTFGYSDITISDTIPHKVRFTVTNTGARAGAEVAQVYIEAGAKSAFRAKRELKGFEKVFLQPGERKEVCITLSDTAFRAYNSDVDDWYVEGGAYTVAVGTSSADIRLTATVTVPQSGIVPKNADLPHYQTANIQAVPDAEFAALLGRALSPSNRVAGAPITKQDTMADAADTKWGRRILKLARFFTRGDKVANSEMMFRGFSELPFSNFKNLTGGAVNDEMTDGILMLLNGKGFWKSIRHIIKHRTKKK